MGVLETLNNYQDSIGEIFGNYDEFKTHLKVVQDKIYNQDLENIGTFFDAINSGEIHLSEEQQSTTRKMVDIIKHLSENEVSDFNAIFSQYNFVVREMLSIKEAVLAHSLQTIRSLKLNKNLFVSTPKITTPDETTDTQTSSSGGRTSSGAFIGSGGRDSNGAFIASPDTGVSIAEPIEATPDVTGESNSEIDAFRHNAILSLGGFKHVLLGNFDSLSPQDQRVGGLIAGYIDGIMSEIESVDFCDKLRYFDSFRNGLESNIDYIRNLAKHYEQNRGSRDVFHGFNETNSISELEGLINSQRSAWEVIESDTRNQLDNARDRVENIETVLLAFGEEGSNFSIDNRELNAAMNSVGSILIPGRNSERLSESQLRRMFTESISEIRNLPNLQENPEEIIQLLSNLDSENDLIANTQTLLQNDDFRNTLTSIPSMQDAADDDVDILDLSKRFLVFLTGSIDESLSQIGHEVDSIFDGPELSVNFGDQVMIFDDVRQKQEILTAMSVMIVGLKRNLHEGSMNTLSILGSIIGNFAEWKSSFMLTKMIESTTMSFILGGVLGSVAMIGGIRRTGFRPGRIARGQVGQVFRPTFEVNRTAERREAGLRDRLQDYLLRIPDQSSGENINLQSLYTTYLGNDTNTGNFSYEDFRDRVNSIQYELENNEGLRNISIEDKIRFIRRIIGGTANVSNNPVIQNLDNVGSAVRGISPNLLLHTDQEHFYRMLRYQSWLQNGGLGIRSTGSFLIGTTPIDFRNIYFSDGDGSRQKYLDKIRETLLQPNNINRNLGDITTPEVRSFIANTSIEQRRQILPVLDTIQNIRTLTQNNSRLNLYRETVFTHIHSTLDEYRTRWGSNTPLGITGDISLTSRINELHTELEALRDIHEPGSTELKESVIQNIPDPDRTRISTRIVQINHYTLLNNENSTAITDIQKKFKKIEEATNERQVTKFVNELVTYIDNFSGDIEGVQNQINTTRKKVQDSNISNTKISDLEAGSDRGLSEVGIVDAPEVPAAGPGSRSVEAGTIDTPEVQQIRQAARIISERIRLEVLISNPGEFHVRGENKTSAEMISGSYIKGLFTTYINQIDPSVLNDIDSTLLNMQQDILSTVNARLAAANMNTIQELRNFDELDSLVNQRIEAYQGDGVQEIRSKWSELRTVIEKGRGSRHSASVVDDYFRILARAL